MSRGITLLFLEPRHSRWEWGVSPTPRPPLPPGKTRYPLYRRLGGPQARSGRAESLASHQDSIPDRPARRQSLYRMSYPAPAALVKNGILIVLFSLVFLFLYFFFLPYARSHCIFVYVFFCASCLHTVEKRAQNHPYSHIHRGWVITHMS